MATTSHLAKWQTTGTRSSSEISDEDLQKCIKKNCTDINHDVAFWMELPQDKFIEQYCSLLMSISKLTYRLNPVQTQKAVAQIYGSSGVNAMLFATKLCKAFSNCWASSKKAHNGKLICPAKFAVIQCWAERHSPSPSPSPEPKRIKVEAGVKVELGRQRTVKLEPPSTSSEPLGGFSHAGEISPIKSTRMWDESPEKIPLAAGTSEDIDDLNPEDFWRSAKTETDAKTTVQVKRAALWAHARINVHVKMCTHIMGAHI